MMIKLVRGRQILDSRGYPTVEADVILENDTFGRASVPSGASTGTNEALELRDGDTTVYGGKGVLNAVSHVNNEIANAIVGMDVNSQSEIDRKMINLDGTPTKTNLGANAMLAVSLACLRASAMVQSQPLYQRFNILTNGTDHYSLPVPFFNIINGGKHAAGSTDIQEFMIIPVGAKTFSRAVRMGAEVFHALGDLLQSQGLPTTVGDEGGYAPSLKGNEVALQLICQAIEKAGYKLKMDVAIGLDVAATSLYDKQTNKYFLKTENIAYTSDELVNWYANLAQKYPIVSIEDGLSETDWVGWSRMMSKLGSSLQLVGDDLLVTNLNYLKKAIESKAANCILIKLNQIGTVSETLQAVAMAKKANWHTMISHRSGETEDTSIAHLAVGVNAGQIKSGSLSRGERVSKYNEIMRIEEALANKAYFNPRVFFRL